MAVYALGERTPDIHPDAFVHPEAVVIGAVTLGPEASVWPRAVLRGDYGAISIGARTSVQDGAVIHATSALSTQIGADCVVEDGCLIGSGSIVLHEAVIHSGALVGAGAVVPGGMDVPGGAMALGVPAQIRPDAVPAGSFSENVRLYVENGHRYRGELRRLD